MVNGEPATVSVVLVRRDRGRDLVVVGSARGAFVVALSAAVLGPLAEIVLVELGAASYADDALFGVAPWLPCLYFGAGAVAAGLWAAVSGARRSQRRPGRGSLRQPTVLDGPRHVIDCPLRQPQGGF